MKKVIEIGDVQAFIQYMRSFMQPISQIANVSNTLQSTAAAAERVFEFLDEEDEVSETESPIVLSEFMEMWNLKMSVLVISRTP